MKAALKFVALALIAMAGDLVACSADVEHVSAEQRGAALFSDGTRVATHLSCSKCHPGADQDSERIYPGASLGGAVLRPTYWGGQENDLLRSINDCRELFQGERSPWTGSERAAQDLYAYLQELNGPSEPVPFTVVPSVAEIPAGDRALGAQVYARACRSGHGETITGKGALLRSIPSLPDDVLLEHAEFTQDQQRLIFVEKVRHGGFFHYGGSMPPFSLETLSDAQLGALLQFLELYSP